MSGPCRKDASHQWDQKRRRCVTCRTLTARARGTEGDRGGVECTMSFSEWQRSVGYDPVTRSYSAPVENVPPVIVLPALNGSQMEGSEDV